MEYKIMKVVRKLLPLVLVAGAAFSIPTSAHHSFAMFDQTNQIQLRRVTVTRFAWTNPHAFLIVKHGDTIFTMECSSPNLMTHQGWKYNSVKAGDQVDITYYPLRNGQPGGMLKTVTLPAGKTLSAW
jgi:hypothetical protein